MKSKPDRYIHLWFCENSVSRVHYDNEQSAIEAVLRKYKMPQSFGIPKYVRTDNESLLVHIEDLIHQSQTDGCIIGARNGVRKNVEVIDFVYKLVEIVNGMGSSVNE